MKSKSRSERSYLINNNQRKRLKRLVTNDKAQNRRLCASGVKKLWKKKTEQEVSVNTIRRTLYSVGLNNHIARRKPLISSKNKAVRLAWSLKHESWSSEDWVKVLWSDESTFIQFQ